MATKKLTLNELRALVKQIIREETDKEDEHLAMFKKGDTSEMVKKKFYQAISKEGLPHFEMFHLGGNAVIGTAKALEDEKFRDDVESAFSKKYNDKKLDFYGSLAGIYNIQNVTNNSEVLKMLVRTIYNISRNIIYS